MCEGGSICREAAVAASNAGALLCGGLGVCLLTCTTSSLQVAAVAAAIIAFFDLVHEARAEAV